MLERAGHTEASVDLARLAGCTPAAVICEMMRPDGTMARMPDLVAFGREHGFKIVTVNDLIAHRLRTDSLIERVASADLPSRYGDFSAVAYRTLIDTREHIAFVTGDLGGDEPMLVRVHDQCVTGDVLRSLGCDCGQQLQTAMRLVGEEGRGVIVYLYQQGRGVGVHQKAGSGHLPAAGAAGETATRGAGPPRLRHRDADPRRPRGAEDAPDHGQPREALPASTATGLEIVEFVSFDGAATEGVTAS